jgi:hypothetical protein
VGFKKERGIAKLVCRYGCKFPEVSKGIAHSDIKKRKALILRVMVEVVRGPPLSFKIEVSIKIAS